MIKSVYFGQMQDMIEYQFIYENSNTVALIYNYICFLHFVV